MPQTSPAGSSLATLSEVPGTELRQLQATFESFKEFVVRYSPWLSDTCIFVETLEAVPVGAPIRLEIRLRDRPFLIRALGQVDWVRAASEGDEDGPPGAALNITYLDPASAHLINSIFRLYTGQQSAAMGQEVVETWELDVESLIDQAFPGATTARAGSKLPDAATVGEEVVTSQSSTAVEAAAPASTSSPAAPPETEVLEELELPIELPRLEESAEPGAEPTPGSAFARIGAEQLSADAGAGDGMMSLETSEPAIEEEELEWEARLSAAFAEHDTAEPAVAPQSPTLAQQPPAKATDSGFGFGLVEEPVLSAADASDDLPPLTDDTATFAADPAPESVPMPESIPTQDLSLRTVRIQPIMENPVPVVPAVEAVATTREDPVPTPEPAAAQPLAGAAAAAGDSDASFLRRSVLAFLLAVVVVGLLLVWLRGRQAPAPKAGETIAETAVPETVALPPDVSPPDVNPSPPDESSASATSPGAVPSVPPDELPVVQVASGPEIAPSRSPAAIPPAAEPAAEAKPTATAVAAQDPAVIVEDVEQRIKAWAAAWSNQQPEAYIECYAPDFSPAGTSRREWENQRAVRIKAPVSILVQAKDISVTVLDGSQARATFYQDYETDTKHLYTWKTMELARLPEGWRIVKERVGR